MLSVSIILGVYVLIPHVINWASLHIWADFIAFGSFYFHQCSCISFKEGSLQGLGISVGPGSGSLGMPFRRSKLFSLPVAL